MALLDSPPPPTSDGHLDRLPRARGPLSRQVLRALRGERSVGAGVDSPLPPGSPHDDDFQLSLWILNVVRAGDFEGVDRHCVGSLRVQNFRWYLERAYEDRLRNLTPQPPAGPLPWLIDDLRSDGSRPAPDVEVAKQRFVTKAPYLAWEADPHTLTLAAVEFPLKQPLADIQSGEYGVGHGDTHAVIYRNCLAALDVSLVEALESAPAEAYAYANSAWLFGADRRLRGASLGQLCLLEMDSVEPCARAVDDWDRFDLPVEARRWYDVHVMADAVHDQVIRQQLIPAIERETPHLLDDAAWGAMVTAELLKLLDAAVLARRR